MMKQKDKGTLPAAKAAPLQGGELLNSFPHWGGIQGGVPLPFLFVYFLLIPLFPGKILILPMSTR